MAKLTAVHPFIWNDDLLSIKLHLKALRFPLHLNSTDWAMHVRSRKAKHGSRHVVGRGIEVVDVTTKIAFEPKTQKDEVVIIVHLQCYMRLYWSFLQCYMRLLEFT